MKHRVFCIRLNDAEWTAIIENNIPKYSQWVIAYFTSYYVKSKQSAYIEPPVHCKHIC